MSLPDSHDQRRTWWTRSAGALAHLACADGAAESPVPSPWAHHKALLAMAPIAALVVAIMALAPWYSNMNVDTLTFMEQVRAVAHGGSIGFDNGPVEQYAELRTRWFVGAHGKAWGILPVVISYLLAPAMVLGGYRGALRALWLLFLLAVLMTYALTYRLTRRPVAAVGAAYALALASSLGMWGIALAPFIPCAAFGITSLYAAHRALHRPAPRDLAMAAIAGLFGGFGIGTHLLWTAPFAAVGGTFALVGSLRQRASRLLAYGLASAPSLLLQSWVNHLRFGTWNPVSYGPCNSDTCTPAVANNQTVGAFASLLGPVLPYAVVFFVALWLVRRSARATGLVAWFGALAALLPDTETRNRFHQLLRTVWGYVVDVGSMNAGLPKGSENLGSFNEAWCARALLQCSPVLAAALLAAPTRGGEEGRRERATLVMLGGACVALLFEVMLRADTGGFNAFGYPFVNFRYVAPILPAATVLAFVALQRLPWRAWHATVALAVAAWGGSRLALAANDQDLMRRQVIHWVPLALAVALFVAVAGTRIHRERMGRAFAHAGALLAAVAVGYGGAVVWGIDRVVGIEYRRPQDERTAELARVAPRRFILLGGYAMDEALALHDRRDIYFINVGMGPRDGRNARLLVDQALRPDRPAFLIQDNEYGPWHFDWPGFEFRRVPGTRFVYQIVRTGT